MKRRIDVDEFAVGSTDSPKAIVVRLREMGDEYYFVVAPDQAMRMAHAIQSTYRQLHEQGPQPPSMSN